MDFRGYFGEPYCSVGCQLMGGTESIQAVVDSRSGSCRVCGKSVHASPFEDRCSVVPIEGSLMFVCLDCRERAKALIADVEKCCKCGVPLD